MRIGTIIVATALLNAPLMGASAPVGQAVTCSETGAGYTETDNCVWSCSNDIYVNVHAYLEEPGSDLWGFADCSDQSASCSEASGAQCWSRSSQTTGQSGLGNCQGGGDGGWYTEITVECYASSSSLSSSDSSQEDVELVIDSMARITVDDGVPRAEVCSGSGVCHPIPVTCIVSGEAWSCGIGETIPDVSLT